MSLQEDKVIFFELISEIRKRHPKLKLKVFNKLNYLPSGAVGEYGTGTLHIATGETNGDKESWLFHITILAHEYAHYLRDLKNSKKYSSRVGYANYYLYTPHISEKKRKSSLYWVLRDEYYTDVLAADILKKWGRGLWDRLKGRWWKFAAAYNTRIKFYYATGKFIAGIDTTLKGPSRKLTLKEIQSPIKKFKMRQIEYLLSQGIGKVTFDVNKTKKIR
jgi:hypothetical protein